MKHLGSHKSLQMFSIQVSLLLHLLVTMDHPAHQESPKEWYRTGLMVVYSEDRQLVTVAQLMAIEDQRMVQEMKTEYLKQKQLVDHTTAVHPDFVQMAKTLLSRRELPKELLVGPIMVAHLEHQDHLQDLTQMVKATLCFPKQHHNEPLAEHIMAPPLEHQDHLEHSLQMGKLALLFLRDNNRELLEHQLEVPLTEEKHPQELRMVSMAGPLVSPTEVQTEDLLEAIHRLAAKVVTAMYSGVMPVKTLYSMAPLATEDKILVIPD